MIDIELEKVLNKAFENKIHISFLDEYKNERGIYFLFNGDNLIYVGQAKNCFSQRYKVHLKKREFNYFFIENSFIGNLDEVESYYIVKYYHLLENINVPVGSKWISIQVGAVYCDMSATELTNYLNQNNIEIINGYVLKSDLPNI